MKAIRQMLTGTDNRYSIRRVLAVFFSVGICFHGTYCTIKNQPINEGYIASLCALIVGLLALTTYQNTKENATDNNPNTGIQAD